MSGAPKGWRDSKVFNALAVVMIAAIVLPISFLIGGVINLDAGRKLTDPIYVPLGFTVFIFLIIFFLIRPVFMGFAPSASRKVDLPIKRIMGILEPILEGNGIEYESRGEPWNDGYNVYHARTYGLDGGEQEVTLVDKGDVTEVYIFPYDGEHVHVLDRIMHDIDVVAEREGREG